MNRRSFFAAALMLAGALMAAATVPAVADGKTHYLAVHVDESDPKRMNLALNNVQNVDAYYKSKGEKVVIELVAYGPGLKMYMADSPVKARIEAMALETDNLQFSACSNTHRKMSAKAGHEIALLGEATMVPSGVIRLMELQEQGYSYLRP
tara:strand:- start:69406 stop:69858 length:453 start_codon:yes stop_codon:yes gene_type:complete